MTGPNDLQFKRHTQNVLYLLIPPNSKTIFSEIMVFSGRSLHYIPFPYCLFLVMFSESKIFSLVVFLYTIKNPPQTFRPCLPSHISFLIVFCTSTKLNLCA